LTASLFLIFINFSIKQFNIDKEGTTPIIKMQANSSKPSENINQNPNKDNGGGT